jgi:hypothetical protein
LCEGNKKRVREKEEKREIGRKNIREIQREK